MLDSTKIDNFLSLYLHFSKIIYLFLFIILFLKSYSFSQSQLLFYYSLFKQSYEFVRSLKQFIECYFFPNEKWNIKIKLETIPTHCEIKFQAISIALKNLKVSIIIILITITQLQWPLENINQQLYSIQIIIKEYQEIQEILDNQEKQVNQEKQEQQEHQEEQEKSEKSEKIENEQQILNNIIDMKNRKYIIQEIDQINYQMYNYYKGSSISKNEQYLTYGSFIQKLLKIYEIKQQKIIKEIQLDNLVYVYQFTQDSSQQYVGLSMGFIHGYNVQDNFKQIYRYQINLADICSIITIQNDYLITCSDQSIIQVTIRSGEQIQISKVYGYTAIDYNTIGKIIVKGSIKGSIDLWNCQNQNKIISKDNAHNCDIRQIQFINNNEFILSLDSNGNIFKWIIDLIDKNLIKLQQYSDQNKIFNFWQINQDQNLLIICNNYAKILDQQGKTINTIEHGCQGIVDLPINHLEKNKNNSLHFNIFQKMLQNNKSSNMKNFKSNHFYLLLF